MEIQEIIDKWKINRALLASKLKMPKGTFNNKLNPSHASQFSDKELFQLKQVLIGMRNDLDVVEQDFNDALKIIAGGGK